MNINTIKKSIPYFKFCYGKNKLINIIDCECINRCKMEYVIPHHEARPLHFYTSLKCDITNYNQKIGNCKCKDICLSSLSDWRFYKFS